MIGFESRERLFYEGSSLYGHAIWPSPILTPASFISPDDSVIDLPETNDMALAKYVFREDSFDPVTRIRRGRFYASDSVQPQQWRVQMHPALPNEARELGREGRIKKLLFTFLKVSSAYQLIKDGRTTVLLGSQGAHSRWTVIAIEAIATAEDLVTLRAKTTLGALPRINTTEIPDVVRDKLLEAIEKVRDTIYRLGPESIIDRCRDAAQIALAGKIAPEVGKIPSDDLAQLARKFDEKGDLAIASAAKIIGRLHARAKPNEQLNRNLRPIREQDSELAVSCLGFLLCDLQWAEW